ncbi:hypothetical protein Q3G72_033415 [Acer saccharum]|nr:hypothetical protein Q3G72_033415 [Acer saccharum]
MSKESWLNTPFVNLDLLWELEDLPIDDRLDDDRDGSKSSNDDDDILNVKVLNFVPSPLDEIISAVAEYCTMMMKRSRSPLRW